MEPKRNGARLDVYLRPLAIPELEESRLLRKPAALDPLRLIAFAGGSGSPITPQEVVSRYNEISTGDLDMIAVPAEKLLLEKTVWPLKSAKVCYCLGQYLSTIAMAGLVGEMLAILLFEARHGRGQGADVPGVADFEKLGQRARVVKLAKLELVTQTAEKAFNEIQEIRRKYLHFLSFPHRQLRSDAKKTYKAAFRLVNESIGLRLVPESYALHVDPDILQYVKRKLSQGKENTH
ncbi:MAG: hypothetical protein NTV86_14390 [Planctomycetota bacterium]|nr:hypothetical protein [Planctomycetota bacterium]